MGTLTKSREVSKQSVGREVLKALLAVLGLWVLMQLYTAVELKYLYEARGTAYILNTDSFRFGSMTVILQIVTGYVIGQKLSKVKGYLIGLGESLIYVVLDLVIVKYVYSLMINAPVRLNVITDKSIYMPYYTGTAYLMNILTMYFLYIAAYALGIYLNEVKESSTAYKYFLAVSFLIGVYLGTRGLIEHPIVYVAMGIGNPLFCVVGIYELIEGALETPYTLYDYIAIPLYSIMMQLCILITIRGVLPAIAVEKESEG